MSRYHRAPIPGGTYFLTLNTYRRQVLLTQAEVLTALRSAHRVVRATRPFRVEAIVSFPIIFMRCGAYRPGTPIILLA